MTLSKEQKEISQHEYELQLTALYVEIRNWKHNDIDNERIISEDNNNLLLCNDWEIEFDVKRKTATIKQYIDWEYRPVSRLVKRDSETVWDFMKRAENLNERLWRTICFETR